MGKHINQRAGKYEQEADRIVAMWNEGASFHAIAGELGVSPGGLAAGMSRLRTKGYKLKKRTGGKPGGNGRIVAQRKARAEIVAMWNGGATVADLAKKYDSHPGAIYSRLRLARKAGLEVRALPVSKKAALCAKYDKELPELWAKGYAAQEIAEKFGVTASAVNSRVHKLRRKGINLERRDRNFLKRRARKGKTPTHAGARPAGQTFKALDRPNLTAVTLQRAPGEFLDIGGLGFTNERKRAYRGTPAQARKMQEQHPGIALRAVPAAAIIDGPRA